MADLCPVKSKFLVRHILASISHSSIKNKFQEVFCLGVVADHFLWRLSLSAPGGTSSAADDMDIASLSELFSSISVAQKKTPAPGPFWNASSADPLESQIKAELLIQILKFVLLEMNSTLSVDEDVVLENMKHLITDSTDLFFLIEKVSSCVQSQISVLMSQFSLTKNFKLRDKIRFTLQRASSTGLVDPSNEIFNLI